MRLSDDVVKFRLACSIPGPEDGTSLMRGMGPLNAMAKEDRRLEIVLPRYDSQAGWMHTWDWLQGCDALFMQRPFLPEHARAVNMAKMMGLPVWVDWDDDLMSFPKYIWNRHTYDPPKIRKAMEYLCRLADVITVSTEELARRRGDMANRLHRLGRNGTTADVRVIPNACHWPFADGPRQRRVLWRGANNHDADLLDALPALAEVAAMPQYSKWKFTFLGNPPWQVEEAIPASVLETDPGGDAFLYMRMLAALNPWVVIVPLRDNAFNRCRSNLAWIEGTCAGAVTLGPNWEEWRRPGCQVYSSMNDLANQLRGWMEQYQEFGPPEPVQRSREWISEKLLLPAVNEERWQILNEFIQRKDAKTQRREEDNGTELDCREPAPKKFEKVVA